MHSPAAAFSRSRTGWKASANRVRRRRPCGSAADRVRRGDCEGLAFAACQICTADSLLADRDDVCSWPTMFTMQAAEWFVGESWSDEL